MRHLRFAILFFAFLIVGTPEGRTAPSFSRGTAIPGAIAYQDSSDKTQFWYIPTTSDELLGERLRAFRVYHFGFGPAYYVKDSDGNWHNSAGGIISGTFSYDLSTSKRAELVKAIKAAFNIDNPKLLPVPLRSPKVTSVVLDKTFGEFGDVEQKIPAGFQIGPEVAFAAGSTSSLFAAVLANAQVGSGIQANPVFSLNVEAKGEFVGDPWTYDVTCDLSQVWKQVRKHGEATVNYSWFKIGTAEYNGLFQDLNKANVCTFTHVEGSLDTATYGRQMAETMKEIFTAINDKAVNGEGFFRFEPNPEAPPVGGGGGGGGFPLWGWSISINLGYSESFFSQSIHFQRRVSYTGRLEAPISFSAVMAVACGPQTKGYFSDLGNSAESCITQDKIDAFTARAKREYDAKNKKLRELAEKLERKEIDETSYEKLVALYKTIDFTDSLRVSPANVANLTKAGITGASSGVTVEPMISDKELEKREKRALSKAAVPNKPSPRVQKISGKASQSKDKH
jgi:hypothetical protein